MKDADEDKPKESGESEKPSGAEQSEPTVKNADKAKDSAETAPHAMDVEKQDEPQEAAGTQSEESEAKTTETPLNPESANVESSTPKALAATTNEDDTTADNALSSAPASAEKPSGSDNSSASQTESEKQKANLSMEERSGKFAAMAKKRGIPETSEEKTDDGEQSEGGKESEKKEDEKEIPVIYVTDSKGRRVKVIDDDAEELDCEFLNNRQAFLNLCQGNHYQFDQLRRAKHSSMMVLWHLHNRDAPKFVQQCMTCSREIL
jgi:hypothetical protein